MKPKERSASWLSNALRSAISALYSSGICAMPASLGDVKLSKYYFWFIFVMYMSVYMTKNCYSAAMASLSAGLMLYLYVLPSAAFNIT